MGCAQASHIAPPSPKAGEVTTPRGRPTANTDFYQQFALCEKLDSGARGSVHVVRRLSDNTEFVAKVCKLDAIGKEVDKSRYQAVINEVSILKQLSRSANAVQFLQFFMQDGLAYMVMERCETTLFLALEASHVSESVLSRYFHQMLAGIEACHCANVVHRDIKPTNFLVSIKGQGPVVKLCDFGLSARVSSELTNELQGTNGTPPFMAPELLMGRKYNAKVDVWSFGVLVHGLLFGDFPYRPKHDAVVGRVSDELGLEAGMQARSSGRSKASAWKAAILAGEPPSFQGASAERSAEALGFVELLLARDPVERPTSRKALRLAFVLPRPGYGDNDGTSLRPELLAARANGLFGAAKGRHTRRNSVDDAIAVVQGQRFGAAADVAPVAPAAGAPAGGDAVAEGEAAGDLVLTRVTSGSSWFSVERSIGTEAATNTPIVSRTLSPTSPLATPYSTGPLPALSDRDVASPSSVARL